MRMGKTWLSFSNTGAAAQRAAGAPFLKVLRVGLDGALGSLSWLVMGRQPTAGVVTGWVLR